MKRTLFAALAVLVASMATAAPVTSDSLVVPVSDNLIQNGDFEAGNVGFTSPYTYVLPSDNDDQYYVLSKPCGWYFQFLCFGDHTSGSGQMFMGNGSVDGGVAYTSNAFDVVAGQTYTGGAWLTSLGCGTCTVAYGNSVATFALVLGDLVYDLGTLATDNAAAGLWERLEFLPWTATASGQAYLQLRTEAGEWSGNDFGMDDVTLVTQPAVPEPGSLVLLGSVLLIAVALVRRRGHAVL